MQILHCTFTIWFLDKSLSTRSNNPNNPASWWPNHSSAIKCRSNVSFGSITNRHRGINWFHYLNNQHRGYHCCCYQCRGSCCCSPRAGSHSCHCSSCCDRDTGGRGRRWNWRRGERGWWWVRLIAVDWPIPAWYMHMFDNEHTMFLYSTWCCSWCTVDVMNSIVLNCFKITAALCLYFFRGWQTQIHLWNMWEILHSLMVILWTYERTCLWWEAAQMRCVWQDLQLCQQPASTHAHTYR